MTQNKLSELYPKWMYERPPMRNQTKPLIRQGILLWSDVPGVGPAYPPIGVPQRLCLFTIPAADNLVIQSMSLQVDKALVAGGPLQRVTPGEVYGKLSWRLDVGGSPGELSSQVKQNENLGTYPPLTGPAIPTEGFGTSLDLSVNGGNMAPVICPGGAQVSLIVMPISHSPALWENGTVITLLWSGYQMFVNRASQDGQPWGVPQ